MARNPRTRAARFGLREKLSSGAALGRGTRSPARPFSARPGADGERQTGCRGDWRVEPHGDSEELAEDGGDGGGAF